MKKKWGKPSKMDTLAKNTRPDVMYRCRYQYFQSDKTMVDFLKTYPVTLLPDEIRWLLEWSGECINYSVTDNGDIVRKGK